MENHSQFRLFRTRRFRPFFFTQALGAFNDNLYKTGLLLYVTFVASQQSGELNSDLLVNLAAGLFILPFFLFSPMAGQLADKFEKSWLIRRIKLAEILIMALGAAAFLAGSVWLMMLLLFAMGTQSAFFGPAKYAILPQHLKSEELVGGNALVEMGTFLAILAGTILSGILFELPAGTYLIGGTVILCALLGYWASRGIPKAEAPDPALPINWNPVTEIVHTVASLKKNRPVLLSILAISWFWFLGASYLTQFNNFAKDVLAGGPQVVTLLLTVFSVGIGAGSLLCERLSGRRIELGIVPIGSLGLSLFGIDLYFAIPTVAVGSEPATAWAFLAASENWRVLIDLLLIGLFGGLFIVPLYAMVQTRSDEKERAQVIAANNILNALFMVIAAAFAALLLVVAKLSIPEYFLVLAIINIFVAGYVYRQVPEFTLRFVIWLLSRTLYRVSQEGLEHIPEEGPAVLVCNHVSYVDAMLLAGASRRPIRFVMDKAISETPGLKAFFKAARTIPIAPEKKDPKTYHEAFEKISQELRDGNLICIFPEGKLTRDGQLNPFRAGIEKIIERDPVPVIPMALQGLWGSYFSHANGGAFSKLPRRFWSRVNILAGPAWQPERVTAAALETEVAGLRGDKL